MKIKVKQKVEMEISYIDLILPVRYGTEDIPADFPGRKGDMWEARIAMDNGEIQGWKNNAEIRELHMKVCDQGTYILRNHCGEEVARIEEDYVPDCVPGSYGDYVELDIVGNRVTNWPTKFDASDFRRFFKCDDD